MVAFYSILPLILQVLRHSYEPFYRHGARLARHASDGCSLLQATAITVAMLGHTTSSLLSEVREM